MFQGVFWDIFQVVCVMRCFRVCVRCSGSGCVLCGVSGCISTIVGLFETATGHADLLLALTETVSSVAQNSRENQNAFVDEGVTQHIVNVILNQVSRAGCHYQPG